MCRSRLLRQLCLSDMTSFHQCVTDKLNNPEPEHNANNIIALLKSQNKYCPATRKETKLNEVTIQQMAQKIIMGVKNLPHLKN